MKNTYDNDEGWCMIEKERIANYRVEANSTRANSNLQKGPGVYWSTFLGLSLLMVGLSGCAHQYTMKLTNGMQITSSNRPKLKGANFYYKGPRGEVEVIPQSRVLEVEPTSMAKEDNRFKVSEPKKKHWYWPF